MKQIDHIYIEVNNPESVFNMLTGKLGLPIAWPVQDYGTFTSGGVSLGNINLEVVRFASGTIEGEEVKISGIALAPHTLQSMLTNIETKGIVHGEPVPFEAPQSNGELRLLWTNVDFTGLLPGLAHVFACAYAFDMQGMNTQNEVRLAASHGGELGVSSAAMLVVSVDKDQFESQRAAWATVLGEEPSAAGEWQFEHGPGLRLEPGAPQIQLALNVSDPEHAAQILAREGFGSPFVFASQN